MALALLKTWYPETTLLPHPGVSVHSAPRPPSMLLGPSGQGFLLRHPCVRHRRAGPATAPWVSPQGQWRRETGPWWDREGLGSGSTAGHGEALSWGIRAGSDSGQGFVTAPVATPPITKETWLSLKTVLALYWHENPTQGLFCVRGTLFLSGPCRLHRAVS